MKKWNILLILALLAALLLSSCGTAAETPAEAPVEEPAEAPVEEADETPVEEDPASKVATADQMTTVVDVVEEGMEPVYGSSVQDGVYEVEVDSSSSMFPITRCELTVENGEMTAVLYMGGTSYLYVYPGTALEAAAAEEADCIPFVETADGVHTFTIPVEALDAGVSCAAYSKNKNLWYDRTLVFRADSLPTDALSGVYTTVADLGLQDGNYTIEVTLSGGSGKASVESPAALRIENGEAFATIIWSSPNYDYMRVDEEQYLPINTEGNSTFEVPVTGFDRAATYYADTTAMSIPHEIEYTLRFDSATIQEAE